MKKNLALALLVIFIFSLFGCRAEQQAGVEINVSAAASLTDALKDIQEEYSKQSKDVVIFNFGGSGTLRKQAIEGAPCDLFISASVSDMDALEKANLLITDSRFNLLGNTLTLVGSKEAAEIFAGVKDVVSILSNADINSISIGTPETVPAGKYAKASLESLKLWDKLQPKLVFAKDVRQVLEYVETGNADLGLVYKTDAMLLKTGSMLGDMPQDSHAPIVYPAALLKGSAKSAAARAFYDFLKTDYSKDIFNKYGFTVLY